MKTSFTALFLQFTLLSLAVASATATATTPQAFLQCLHRSSKNSQSISQLIFTPTNSSYASILSARIYNIRFDTPSAPKPFVIVTPIDASQVQTVIYCAQKKGLRIRIRSGGHSREGQSYQAKEPFVLLDMYNLRSIDVDVKTSTAWVGAGATLGEVYYAISRKSKTLGFPGGLYSTVGLGGYIGGGGYGMMKRKYGLAADNTLDVSFVDVNGRILNRKSMGEDLFWAIRGGTASSFGVVLQWKIRLVPVPRIVTIFGVARTLEQNGSYLFQKWQSIAPNFESRDLDIRAVVDTIESDSSPRKDKKTVRFVFQSLFLGRINNLLPIMQKSFPELGLVKEDCTELSWIETAPFFSTFTIDTPPEILLNRSAPGRRPTSKIKSSFAQEPLSEENLNGIWERLLQLPTQIPLMQYTPFGGKMTEFSESALPFPHRPGVLYMINMGVYTGNDETERLKWINELFRYYAPFVTKNPRTSYVNYDDLDLGHGSSNYAEASVWGRKYFKNNFDRLVKIKSVVDPNNFFRTEQSIPPY